ncbi:MAG: c-type cytochrome [Alphaproteobacteria bacterium]|nr:c-type cytochrome [Alphaproteobacteria bacterium]
MKLLPAVAAACVLAGLAAAAPPDDASGKASARADLGRRLFYDADLSIDGTMSCATCHEQKHAFAETNRTHPGVTGEPGRRNVPGLANVAGFSSLTWADPGLRSLEAQVLVPFAGDHPVEMGMKGKEAELARRLGGDPCYVAMFARAFPGDGAITVPDVAEALAAFERTLTSRSAPYDRWRASEADALPANAQRGAALFAGKTFNCASCHSGPDFTDTTEASADPSRAFHNIGESGAALSDAGLYETTHRTADAGRFRTPSLRNVALTAPYLHDGSAATLEDAIAAHYRNTPGRDAALGATAPNTAETDDLIAFLQSLTDDAFIRDPRFSLPRPGC